MFLLNTVLSTLYSVHCHFSNGSDFSPPTAHSIFFLEINRFVSSFSHCVAGLWATKEMSSTDNKETNVQTTDNKETNVQTTIRELVVYSIFLLVLSIGRNPVFRKTYFQKTKRNLCLNLLACTENILTLCRTYLMLKMQIHRINILTLF